MFLISLSSLISFLVFYYGTNLVHLFISNGILGLCAGSQISASILILTEYTSPCYRGIFLTLKSATLYWGMWTANAIGTFYHWKNIGIVGVLCSLYMLVTLIFWPESPYWLAKRRKFDECSKSHRWLKGSGKDSERELEKLIKSDIVKKYKFRQIYRSFMAHKLYKSLIICAVVICLYHCSGKLVCSVYAIDIIKSMTSSESTAYTGMLILDGVTVLSMYVGCFISKFVKRRTQFLVSSSIAAMSLFVLSLYMHLIKIKIINDNKILSLGLLVIFSVSICCGPIIMSTSVIGEVLPLKCRNFCVCVMAITANLVLATAVKCGPVVFKTFDLDGAFLFYGICFSFFLFLTYKVLPETKDKTLQEIQEYLGGKPMKEEEMDELVTMNKNANSLK